MKHYGKDFIVEHTFPNQDQVKAFDDEMATRTARAKGDEHYQKFLARIGTREEFQIEMEGKLKAVIESGYPLGIRKEQVSEIVAILALDIVGDPQFWPPQV